MTSSWTSPEFQIKPLREIAEHSLTVLDLAERKLQAVGASWSSEYACDWLGKHGFDAAPLKNVKPYRFIDKKLRPDSEPVSHHAQPMDSSLLVSGDLGLADAVLRLKNQPYYFVLQGEGLAGIVTRADLQRPTVSMVLFSMILAAESAANLVIEERLGSRWMGHLDAERLDKAQQIFYMRKRTSTEVTLLECLMLRDRLDLIGKCQSALEDLGFASNSEFKRWKEQAIRVRNCLAHGGTLLHAEQDPVSAIDLFEKIRSFAQATWDITANTP